MKLMSLPFKLYRIQQIDSQIDQHRARLQEIEAAISHDQALADARLQNEFAQGELTDALKSLKRAEDEVRTQRIKIEQSESTLYGGRVRNPKELQDLQKEVAALKRYMSVLEDRQLETMIVFEEKELAQSQTGEQLQQAVEQNRVNNLALTAEKQTLLHELERLSQDRNAAVIGLAPDEIATYESLRQSRRGLAVAKVVGASCAACGTQLSAALLHASRSQTQLSRCSTCGRILYTG